MVPILMLSVFHVLLPTLPRATSWPQENAKKSVVSNVYEDRDGYELLSLVLNKEAQKSKQKELSIYSKTVEISVSLVLCNTIPDEFQSAADDLATKSNPKQRFKRLFSLSQPYQLTPLYGATDYGISAVGFDLPRTHAVASVVRGCGSMCSDGSTYLFRKTQKGWQVVGQVCGVQS
jgi:hypothetical protein